LFFWPHGHASKELALLFWCIANCHNGRDGAGQAGNYELRAKRNYSASPVLPNADRSVQLRPIPTRLGPLKKEMSSPETHTKFLPRMGAIKLVVARKVHLLVANKSGGGLKGWRKDCRNTVG